jgi:site-specific DNA-cytosine methylase
MTALGIHIYAGGFSVGVRNHFNILAHLENSQFGRKTVERNFPGLPIYHKPEEWPVESFKGVDLIYGNPPCKFWSSAGSKKGQKLSEKYEELMPPDHVEFQSVCFKLQPKIFMFESVPNILTQDAKGVRGNLLEV